MTGTLVFAQQKASYQEARDNEKNINTDEPAARPMKQVVRNGSQDSESSEALNVGAQTADFDLFWPPSISR